MGSPSPDSQPSAPPPSDGDSSPPPPPSDDSPSTPPPSSPPPASPPPPPTSSPPPPEESSSPPPPPPTPPPSDSPPPPKTSSSPPPPPPPLPPPSKSSSSPPPPPPVRTSGSSKHSPPPPPRSALAPPKSTSHSSPATSSSSASQSESDGSSNTSQSLPIIIGVAVGAGLLFLVMVSLCVACRRKKKRRPDHPTSFYAEPPRPLNAGEYYYSNQHQQEAGWHGSSAEHVVQLPTPPGMRQSPHLSWPPQPPPPPPHGSSGDMSSGGFSSSHGSARPPPHSSTALGFTQSSFSYQELAAATGGFSQNHILGQGGFGYVYKGVLPNGKETAVKCLKTGSGQGDREFQAEVEIISRVHHRHLVSLEGYCIAGEQRILVYEFVSNKTLEYHLHGKDRPTMDWATRLKIALGSAKGLAYLHEDCHPRIIHRDIKAANILLDYNFDPKVADFGLAKLTSDNYTHVSTRVMGTFGYLAPEYAASGKLTEKSDTFSFGVMLLELITGRRPVDITGELMEDSLVDWARPLIESVLHGGNFRELVDPRLEDNFDPQEMARMVACAGACTRHSAKRRPKMSQVVRALEGDASLDDLNAWNKQTQSSVTGDSSSSSSSDYDRRTYAADMKKLGKVSSNNNSQGYSSGENGATSEYGLNPSSSSSSCGNSREINGHPRGNRTRAA